jgi:D-alanyl-D-alanine carboxypeptidase
MRSILSAALIRAATERSRPHSAIAQARPVPAPRPVARPMPVVAQAPATTTPSPPVTQWPATISANAPAPAITSAQANPKVEMARVRPLMIAPAQAVRAPRDGSGTAQAAARAPGGLLNGFAASPPAADASQPARIELPALPPPIEPATASASATPGTSRAFEDIAPAQTPAATPQFRGAQPSTLQAQAQNLARGAPAVPAPGAVAQPQPQLRAPQQRIASTAPTGSPYRLNGPQPAAGTLAVQVGAYNTVAEAERQLERTRNALPDRLDAGAASAVPALVGGKQVYRARFTGFDAEGAAHTCSELRRRQIDCHVARAD